MSVKKQIQPGEKVPLKLTAAARKLLLEGLACMHDDYEQIIRNTPIGQPVMMTLEELDDFAGFIAAEANHCESMTKQKKLDSLFQKIQDLLDKYADDLQPPTVKIEDARKGKRRNMSELKALAATGTLFQFKVTLLGSQPPIWRRIQVQDCTLDKLHGHIQTAMGWMNSHLHIFEINGQRYADPELLEEGFDDFGCAGSTRTTMISQILPETGKRIAFKYEYDFGDGWEHEILFEGCPALEKGRKYPVCLEGERACPPEDVGGIGGFENFLNAIANPKHREHKFLLEWYGGSFSPDKFDSKKATREMKKGLPDWRRM